MAHIVLSERVAEAGLADRVTVDSFGTGDWHVGGPMDHRAAATLTGEGYDPTRHRARQFTTPRRPTASTWCWPWTTRTPTDLRALGVDPDRLRLFRAFDPEGGPEAEVPDPYYDDDGFGDVLAMVERTSARLVDALERQTSPA